MKLYEVNLKAFCDDANGAYGLAPVDCIQNDKSFNAFWNKIGIFHDVFEHWFEHKHKYFRGEYAMNQAGEMAAMGHAAYFYEALGRERLLGSGGIYSFEESVVRGEIDSLIDIITHDGSSFGYEFKTRIPKQSCMEDNLSLECIIKDQYTRIKDAKLYEEYPENSLQWKNSLSLGKVLNLYRWGYKQAQNLVERGESEENRQVLLEFMDFWNKFTCQVSGEDFYNYYWGIDFVVRKVKGLLVWTATCRGHEKESSIYLDSRKLPKYIDFENYAYINA